MASDPPENVTRGEDPSKHAGIDPNNAGLPFNVSFATLATYSVAAAVLVQCFGFIIAASYYSRAGVAPVSIPLVTIWAAGSCFAVITAYYFYVGAAVARMAPRARTKRDLIELIGYELVMGIGFYFFLAIFFSLRWPGPGIYMAVCALLGAGIGRHGPPSYWFKLSRDRVHFPDVARLLVPVIVALWLFSKTIFPNFPHAIGGGAPIPVVVQLSNDAAELLPAGSRTYEVFSDAAFVYLEVMLGKDAERNEADKSEEEARDPFDLPRTRYVQIPVSAVRSIRRLHPFSTPPPHGVAVPASTIGSATASASNTGSSKASSAEHPDRAPGPVSSATPTDAPPSGAPTTASATKVEPDAGQPATSESPSR